MTDIKDGNSSTSHGRLLARIKDVQCSEKRRKYWWIRLNAQPAVGKQCVDIESRRQRTINTSPGVYLRTAKGHRPSGLSDAFPANPRDPPAASQMSQLSACVRISAEQRQKLAAMVLRADE